MGLEGKTVLEGALPLSFNVPLSLLLVAILWCRIPTQPGIWLFYFLSSHVTLHMHGLLNTAIPLFFCLSGLHVPNFSSHFWSSSNFSPVVAAQTTQV